MGRISNAETEKRRALLEEIIDEKGGGINKRDLILELERRAKNLKLSEGISNPSRNTINKDLDESKWKYNRHDSCFYSYDKKSNDYFILARLLPELLFSISFIHKDITTIKAPDINSNEKLNDFLTVINEKSYFAFDNNIPCYILLTFNRHQQEDFISELLYSDNNYVSHIITGICCIQVYFNARDDIWTFGKYLYDVINKVHVQNPYAIYYK